MRSRYRATFIFLGRLRGVECVDPNALAYGRFQTSTLGSMRSTFQSIDAFRQERWLECVAGHVGSIRVRLLAVGCPKHEVGQSGTRRGYGAT